MSVKKLLNGGLKAAPVPYKKAGPCGPAKTKKCFSILLNEDEQETL